ncbi:hypothetical protein CLU93_4838 [Janthinobacterium sp. 35]|jgi:hypothetical protein|uniref:hypothetical protein n=1 Tax=Janthinobacterium sp. 35 TaxID=2035210 RepID=UPI000C555D8F|nr:hypothetical protein [Janthinobacterium sp. 35]PIG30499.1 hypothetical protein CLU93_4838 [Janthinobacterium sp. 35]
MRTISLGRVKLSISEDAPIPISISDFTQDAGTIEFIAREGYLSGPTKHLFRLEYPGYIIESCISNGQVFIRRNGLHQNSAKYDGSDPYHVAIQWTATSVGCGITPKGEDMNAAMRSVHTPYTTPPLGMIRDLKCGSQRAGDSYPSVEALFSRVLDCLSFCEMDIRRYGAEKFLWTGADSDIEPLSEPEMSRLVASFLAIYGGVNNFEVSCEPRAGGGSVDFCVYGHVENVGQAKIAIEAKKAHSADLEHGFTHQLPAYMERLETRHGIYLVYWLRSDRYLRPDFPAYHNLEIDKLHPLARAGYVRSVGLNLALDRSPSRI